MDTFIPILRDRQIVKWMAGVTPAFLVYDILLTLGDEYRYVWRARWTPGKVLYLAVRYPINLIVLGFVVYLRAAPEEAITIKLCQASFYVQTLGGWLQVILVQAVLGLRTVALYNKSTKIVAFLCFLGCLSVGTTLAFCIVLLKTVVYGVVPYSALVECTMDCPACKTIVHLYDIPILIFDTSLLLLTGYKYYRHSRRAALVKTPLLTILYRDGFMYFAVVTGSVIGHFVLWNTARKSIASIMDTFITVFGTSMAARLLLNIRCELMQPSQGFPIDDVSGISSQLTGRDAIGASIGLGIWNVPVSLSYGADSSIDKSLGKPPTPARLALGSQNSESDGDIEMLPRRIHH